tara:strand:+ start:237 stop:404 length:168 start_codon:yes stop_codon:yes gene_type:complete
MKPKKAIIGKKITDIFKMYFLILKSKEVNFDEILWTHVTITLHHTIIINAKPRVV